MSISTIVISEDNTTVELLKLYLEEFEKFSFLAGTSDFSKAYDKKDVYTFIYRLKSFQESFNIARSAFVLGNPAMARGIWFRYIEHCNYNLEARFAQGYGHAYYPNKEELVKNGVIKQEDIIIDFQKLEKAVQATDLLQ